MAAAEGQSSPQTSHEMAWHEVVLQTLKRNDIRLVPYVPDRVLTTLIKNIHADPFFTTFPTAREEEAVGIVSGAWMAGMKGAVLMQTSGFATLANVLASLAVEVIDCAVDCMPVAAEDTVRTMPLTLRSKSLARSSIAERRSAAARA